jgi:hypothetical protein
MSHYYIEYPIPISCGLKCRYCFHAEKWELEAAGKADSKYTEVCPFTPQQYITWRNKYLSDGTEFLCELHGGEISYGSSQNIVLDVIDTLDKEHFQLQTNGKGDSDFYRELILRKDKINRIGFTYHRQVLTDGTLIDRFMDNVTLVYESGIKTYVKELLFPDQKDAILKHKRYWEERGVEFRIQDFKGYRGRDSKTMITYTAEDWALIHSEYRHESNICSCREGYTQILIRGYDIFAGDVLACWNDPTVIGSIPMDTYTPYQQVNILNNGGRDVAVQKKVYRGSYPYDFWHPDIEKEFKSLDRNQITDVKNKEVIMLARYQEMSDALTQNQQNINAEVLQVRSLIQNCEARLRELETEGVRLAGKAEMLNEVISMNRQETSESVAVEAVGAV